MVYKKEKTYEVMDDPDFIDPKSTKISVNTIVMQNGQLVAGYSDGHIVLFDIEECCILKTVSYFCQLDTTVNIIKYYPNNIQRKNWFFVVTSNNNIYWARFTRKGIMKNIQFHQKFFEEFEDYVNCIEVEDMFNFVCYTDQAFCYIA